MGRWDPIPGYFAFPGNNATLWTHEVDSTLLSSPVVWENRVYIGTMGGSVLCLSGLSGNVLWEHETGGPVESTPAVEGGRLYVGSDDRSLYCLDALSGALAWTASTGGEIKSSPAVVGGRVYVGSNDFKVYCYDAISGTPLWNFSTGGWVYSSPVVWEGGVYFGSCDGLLYCVNATTGEEMWSFEAAYMPASVAISAGVLVAGAYDDRLYAIDPLTGAEVWNASIGAGGIYSSATFMWDPVQSSYSVAVGENGGHLSIVWDGAVQRSWDFDTAIKSSPLYAYHTTDEIPRPPTRAAVIVGTGDGELVAVNPFHNSSVPASGPEFWWRIRLGSSITSSPFMYNGRVYIGAETEEGGVIACIGYLTAKEGVLSFQSPAPGDHVPQEFTVAFNATGLDDATAVVYLDDAPFPATRVLDHWEANVTTGNGTGPVRLVARVLGIDGRVLAEDSLDVVARDLDGSKPLVVITEPKYGERVDDVLVASGRVEGEYPPTRLEWSWDDSGYWTSIDPDPNWTFAATTIDLTDGRHALRARAFDGMFTGEASVEVTVGDEETEPDVAAWDVVAIILLLVVLAALMLTRPRRPPRPSVPTSEPTGKG